MLPLTRSRNRARFFGIPFSPALLFANGEQGAWYDPSDYSTLFQDAAGTTPVTAVEQPVRLMLDKSGRGNHATAPSDTARPTLRARYNLLTRTEEFNDAAWSKSAGVTVTPNTDVAPDGTLTADTVTSGNNQIDQGATVAQNTLYTDSLYFKKTSGATYQPGLYLLFSGGTLVIYAVRLNTDTGVATAVSAGGYTAPTSFAVADAGNYWRLSITGNSNNNTTGALRLYPNLTAGGGTGAGSQVIWGADLCPASQATGLIGPTYQRVGAATDYDTAGFLPYLWFDGIDDSMSTGSINPGAVDKAQVFAGVRRVADSSYPVICEFSADWNANSNSFFFAGSAATLNRWFIGLNGTSRVWYEPQTYTPPITNVLSAQYDAAGAAIATQVIPRVNGVVEQENPSGGSAGASNFGTYPLFIGARNSASFFFNGWLTSLIVRFGPNLSTSQIEATESWVNQKTGAY